jgi:hypothetical protein
MLIDYCLKTISQNNKKPPKGGLSTTAPNILFINHHPDERR